MDLLDHFGDGIHKGAVSTARRYACRRDGSKLDVKLRMGAVCHCA